MFFKPIKSARRHLLREEIIIKVDIKLLPELAAGCQFMYQRDFLDLQEGHRQFHLALGLKREHGPQQPRALDERERGVEGAIHCDQQAFH